MICPVCQHANIPSLTTTCPSCSTSLLGIKLLDGLEEKYIETVKEKVALEGEMLQKKIDYHKALKKKNRWIRNLLFLLFMLPILYCFFCRNEPKIITPTVASIRDTIDIYRQELAEKEIALDTIRKRLQTIQSTQHIRELKYIVKEGDLLFDLGLLFYNDKTAWYQIALDNNIYDVKGLTIGDTLLIKYRD